MAQHFEYNCAQHLLAKVHHRVHVGVSPVKLEHRELGIVSRGDTFVAKVAIEFVNLFETANEQSLQVKFGRDACIQVNVERVVMGFERPRRRSGGEWCQHRSFNFDVTVILENPSQFSNRGRTVSQKPRAASASLPARVSNFRR